MDADVVQLAIRRLQAIPGIVGCWVLPNDEREPLERLENEVNRRLSLPGIEIVNEGVRDVLRRQHVLVAAHSSELRHPPGSIVIMLNGDNVVGQEVWEPSQIEEMSEDSNSLLLGKNLILKREALLKARGKSLKLVYRGLPFPELEVCGVRDVVSVTITVPVHTRFSAKAGWNPDDPNVGTVLIGFNEELPNQG